MKELFEEYGELALGVIGALSFLGTIGYEITRNGGVLVVIEKIMEEFC